jgi:hypothetical protein
MRSNKLVGLVLAAMLALAPTAALAHGGFGGGGGGGHAGGGGGGHAGGGGHLGGGHFVGFGGRSFAGFSFAQHQGGHFARHGDFRDRDHFRDRGHFRHDGEFFFGGPFFDDYSDYGYDYPNYGYYDDYSGEQSSAAEAISSQVVIAVQKELTQLGYYHGRVDGLVGPHTERAIRWFQSVDQLPVTGQIDDRTLKALRIS